jgi:hypothetical protein
MKHKEHFIEEVHLDPKLAWIKARLESDALPDPLALPGKLHSHLHEIIAKLIPTGYQDETGFHFGEPPNQ